LTLGQTNILTITKASIVSLVVGKEEEEEEDSR
jgi:hypothetical protein